MTATLPVHDRSRRSAGRARARVPLNVFGMAFGLVGLATAWRLAGGFGLAPTVVGDVLVVAAALVWLVSVGLYLRHAIGTQGAFVADLQDRTAGPFAALAVITPMILAASGVAPRWPVLGAVLVDVFLVLTVVLGAWLTGYWMRGGLDIDRLHPGYFLPTVAGGLVAALCAVEVGQQRLAQVMLGLGLVCWFVLGSMILARLIFRPPLPVALAPTMAIEVAPAAVASLAYLALTGGRLDGVVAAFAGYGLLMVLAQLALLPVYRTLRFSLGTWAFTFSWTAVASTVLFWIHLGQPPAARVLGYLVLAAVSLLVGTIAARTLVALGRGQLLPRPTVTPAVLGSPTAL